MIGRLTGRLLESEPDGTVLLEVGGVGYEVTTPVGAIGRAAVSGDALTLHVHTHVREDALELFGFASATERSAFRALLTVSHVGPKLALAVLGALDVAELAAAIDREDLTSLKKIPGVGLKTAQRIALELKGKLGVVAADAVAPRRAKIPEPATGPKGQLTDALVRMGWKLPEVERAVSTLPDLDRPLGELLREALAALAR
ncbi:MAG: Holliday junction branch migration protein RuvA [Deltaproteobacteria bacterium]|nr:Holliday junction branch migration protein RuvA [Deltaproteobacteria bacterium]